MHLEITDADREAMRYDPAEHREFEGARCLHLGHECNTPIYVLDSFAWAVCGDKPPTWPAKVSWRFPLLTGQDRLAIRPAFAYIADQAALDRWMGPYLPDCEPWPFSGPEWVWETSFRFAIERRADRQILAGGKIESGCFACITMTRGPADQAREALLAVAEVIEALNADRQSLLARESDFCCFCGRDLLEPRSRVVGYGPKCAKVYQLPY